MSGQALNMQGQPFKAMGSGSAWALTAPNRQQRLSLQLRCFAQQAHGVTGMGSGSPRKGRQALLPASVPMFSSRSSCGRARPNL